MRRCLCCTQSLNFQNQCTRNLWGRDQKQAGWLVVYQGQPNPRTTPLEALPFGSKRKYLLKKTKRLTSWDLLVATLHCGKGERGELINDDSVSEDGIFPLILNLDLRNSGGPDMIPNEFLRRYAERISKLLSVICQSSPFSTLYSQWPVARRSAFCS